MVDAVINFEDKKSEYFTICNVQQVIWAKCSKEEIRIRIVGEETPVTIDSKDQCFKFYYDQFSKHKSQMLTNIQLQK